MTFLYIVVALVLVFDFLNGFHDSANSIATVVSTKVLSPFAAVIMAAFFNFIAFTVFPLKVAHTIGKGVVNPDVLNLTVIASALVAAIIWKSRYMVVGSAFQLLSYTGRWINWRCCCTCRN